MLIIPCTSPEDQKILEEEFQKTSRPNKATRQDIVSRVALGEKEVQIWFQNRRQASRRKSRESDSHGSASHPPSDISDGSVVSSMPNDASDNVEKDAENHKELQDADANAALSDEGRSKEEDPVAEKPTETSETQSTVLEPTSSAMQSSAPTDFANSQPSQPIPASQETISSTYIANRRHASTFLKEEEEVVVAQSTTEARSLARSGSAYLRISMTDDGQATIVDRAAKSHERPQSSTGRSVSRRGSLRRSYSAAGFTEDQTQSQDSKQTSAKVPRISKPGRSRDSRTWEFYCDSDARNSNTLSKQANQELSGSASEAIGLMRSNSNRALRINPSKLNSPHSGQHGRVAEAGSKKRGPLKRATTAHGRIQSNVVEILADAKKPAKKGGDDDGEDEFERPNTDSDKENWEPEDERRGGSGSGSQQKAASQPGKRRVLSENSKVMSQSSSLGAMMAHERRSKRGQAGSSKSKSKVADDVDDEVAGFMRGASSTRTATGTSSGDELDCVHSLLSLSQGNWR